jgi:hypothetical protein
MEFSRNGTLSIFDLLFSIFYLAGRSLFCGLCNLFSNRKYKIENRKYGAVVSFAGTTAFYFARMDSRFRGIDSWKGGAKKGCVCLKGITMRVEEDKEAKNYERKFC